MKQQPMTTADLFSKVYSNLKEKGRLPDILDYGLPTYSPVQIRTCDFELKNNLGYGGSEGIYLDLWIVYFEGGEGRRSSIGTFKTLEDDGKAMHSMAHLLADFILEAGSYVSNNQDDFNWTGVNVHMLDENGKKANWGYCCDSMEEALKRKDELMEKYADVVIRDNATRTERRFIRQTVEADDKRKEETGDVQAG